MLISRFPFIIARSKFKATQAREKAQLEIVKIAKEKSRVASGEMRDGWEESTENWEEGYVFNMVAHTVYNEYGTVNMSAQPMLRPALEQVVPKFQDDLRGIYRL